MHGRQRNFHGLGRQFCAAWLVCGVASAAGTPSTQGDAVFARVGETTITRQEYEMAVGAAVRGRFYHGKAPEAEVLKLRRDVGEKLVDGVLLRKEAQRRRIVADQAAIQKVLDAQDARYKSNPEWQARRTELLTRLARMLEEENIVKELEGIVRNAPQPAAKEIEAYYATHPDKFTEPEQFKVSLILLKVDPSSPKAKWDAARADAAAIVKRLATKADFAQIARKQSGDESAAKGGDLGYLHRGMLPDAAQDALDKLKPGAVSDPVVLLEGVAVLRLDDRKPPKLQPLASVQERARELLRREQGETAWRTLITKLRKDTPARIDETAFVPVAAPVNAKPGSSAGR